MSACYHTNQTKCDNCRAPWMDEMKRQLQPPFIPSQFPPLPRVQVCEHCYCEDVTVNGKQHRRCCNCAHQRAYIGGPLAT